MSPNMGTNLCTSSLKTQLEMGPAFNLIRGTSRLRAQQHGLSCKRLGTEQEPLAQLADVGFSEDAAWNVLGTGKCAPRMELAESVTILYKGLFLPHQLPMSCGTAACRGSPVLWGRHAAQGLGGAAMEKSSTGVF